MERRPCSADRPPVSARQGSRVSLQGMSGPTVSLPTLCPLGQPNKAVGLESPIEPWSAYAAQGSLQAQRSRIGRTDKAMTPQSPAKRNLTTTSLRHRASPQRARAGCRKSISPLQPRRKCFFLTSPFIEHSLRPGWGCKLTQNQNPKGAFPSSPDLHSLQAHPSIGKDCGAKLESDRLCRNRAPARLMPSSMRENHTLGPAVRVTMK